MCANVLSSSCGLHSPHRAPLSFHDLPLFHTPSSPPYVCPHPCPRPQSRSPRMPKGDVNGTWQHDMYAAHNSLGARLGNKERPPKMNLSLAERALAEATGEKGISIKGASSRGNVVEVSGLADGTTSADVEVRPLIRPPRTRIARR